MQQELDPCHILDKQAPKSLFTQEQIAKIAHQVNKAYCEALGDLSQVDWVNAPEWQRDSARKGVALHTENNVGPEASHISWLRQKEEDGWIYGAIKNPEKKEHPCMLPFRYLPKEQQAKDFIFRAVVHACNEIKGV